MNFAIEKAASAIELDAGVPLPDVRQARFRAGLSQQAFAERIATPVATV